LKVACLEEVALRAGFIDRAQMNRLIDRRPEGEYREYLRIVAEEASA
jgi:glucose-1-phosphate thymidylyltransferase